MKTIFVLKITALGTFGFYDGKTNWSENLYEAKKFVTYGEAEQELSTMFENHSTGGYIQIEKYFVAA